MLLVALIALPALAHSPTVTLDYIDGISTANGPITIITQTFPYALDFEGRVFHEGQGNLNQVELSATVNGELIYGPQSLQGSGNATETTYTIPYTLEAAGIYSVTITAIHRTDDIDSQTGCKAAPAIANAYLKETQTDRTTVDGTNVVAAVGQQTGKDGALWAKEKCTPEYEVEVVEFVMDVLAD